MGSFILLCDLEGINASANKMLRYRNITEQLAFPHRRNVCCQNLVCVYCCKRHVMPVDADIWSQIFELVVANVNQSFNFHSILINGITVDYLNPTAKQIFIRLHCGLNDSKKPTDSKIVTENQTALPHRIQAKHHIDQKFTNLSII